MCPGPLFFLAWCKGGPPWRTVHERRNCDFLRPGCCEAMFCQLTLQRVFSAVLSPAVCSPLSKNLAMAQEPLMPKCCFRSLPKSSDFCGSSNRVTRPLNPMPFAYVTIATRTQTPDRYRISCLPKLFMLPAAFTFVSNVGSAR